jgi:hypothetical protein
MLRLKYSLAELNAPVGCFTFWQFFSFCDSSFFITPETYLLCNRKGLGNTETLSIEKLT